ncbi:MAG: T9SS type A sorting domain-containing protein [Paludibacter sp.]
MKKRLIILILCIRLVVSMYGQKTIDKYEYWFDNDYKGKITTTVSPVSSLHLTTSLSTFELPVGLHKLQIRFKESADVWSSTSSQFFVKTPKSIVGQGIISQYEYWFDNEFATKVQQTLSLTSELSFTSSIVTSTLPVGLHSFQIRFKESSGVWSSTNTQFFFKKGKSNLLKNQISKYEYWFDNDYTNKVNEDITSGDSITLVTALNVRSLTDGLHSIQFRFADNNGIWSSTDLEYFTKTTSIISGTEEKSIGFITLYLNPATEFIFINGFEGVGTIRLIDLNGKQVLSKHVFSNESLSVTSLAKGIYVVKLSITEGELEWKVIKR